MTLPLLLAAAAGGSPVEGLRQTFEHFGVEPKYIIMQAISFLIVLGVLYKFFIKPVTATMDERNRKIEAGIRHAEEMQAKLAAAQQECAELVHKAQLEATRVVDEARRTAKEYLDRQTQEAAGKAGDMLAKARQAIELEHHQMMSDARSEITRLVITTTERVLAKNLSEADRAAYSEAATRELAEIKE
jgi:F-type H+-transporting ATPase subunit b